MQNKVIDTWLWIAVNLAFVMKGSTTAVDELVSCVQTQLLASITTSLYTKHANRNSSIILKNENYFNQHEMHDTDSHCLSLCPSNRHHHHLQCSFDVYSLETVFYVKADALWEAPTTNPSGNQMKLIICDFTFVNLLKCDYGNLCAVVENLQRRRLSASLIFRDKTTKYCNRSACRI